MTDPDLDAYWPDLGSLVAELRRVGREDVADQLLDGLRVGGSSDEILGEVSLVLRRHRALRRELGATGAKAWDGILRDAHRAFPGTHLSDWVARLNDALRRLGQPRRVPGDGGAR